MFQNLPNCKCLDFRTESFISSSSGGWVRTAGWSEPSLVPARPHTNPSTQSAGIWQLDGSHFSASRTFFPGILIYFPVPPETHNLTIYLVSWTGLHILLLQNRDDLSEQIRILFANNVLCGDYCTVGPFDNPFVNLTAAALCVDNQTHNQNILRRPGVQYRTQCNQISVTTQQHKTKIVGGRSHSSWIEISFDQHQVIAADAGCESFVNSLSFNAGDFMSWMFLEKCLLGIKFWDNSSCHCHQGSYKNLEGVGGWKLHESMVGGGGGNGMRER